MLLHIYWDTMTRTCANTAAANRMLLRLRCLVASPSHSYSVLQLFSVERTPVEVRQLRSEAALPYMHAYIHIYI